MPGFKQANEEVNLLSKALAEAGEAVASAMIPYWRINRTFDEKWRLRFCL